MNGEHVAKTRMTPTYGLNVLWELVMQDTIDDRVPGN